MGWRGVAFWRSAIRARSGAWAGISTDERMRVTEANVTLTGTAWGWRLVASREQGDWLGTDIVRVLRRRFSARRKNEVVRATELGGWVGYAANR